MTNYAMERFIEDANGICLDLENMQFYTSNPDLEAVIDAPAAYRKRIEATHTYSELTAIEDAAEADPEIWEALYTAAGKILLGGEWVPFSAVVELMDDDLREELHAELAPCSDQEFLDAYVDAHLEKFGEEFRI